jgi:hypothetical protein
MIGQFFLFGGIRITNSADVTDVEKIAVLFVRALMVFKIQISTFFACFYEFSF